MRPKLKCILIIVYLEVKMQKNNLFAFTRLEYCVTNVVVKNVNLVTSNGCISKAVTMCLG